MADPVWGNIPLGLQMKLEKIGISHPDDLPSDERLVKLLGEGDARDLRDTLDELYQS